MVEEENCLFIIKCVFQVRENYDDPWPEPITRQDYWGEIDEQEDIYTSEELPLEEQRHRKRPLRRLESIPESDR